MSDYETKLSPEEEARFLAWKAMYAPQDSGFDYDLRGAFKAGLTPDPQSGHWPDTFKKPNHSTFSRESIYAQQRPDMAGYWNGDAYVPPQDMFSEQARPLGRMDISIARAAVIQQIRQALVKRGSR